MKSKIKILRMVVDLKYTLLRLRLQNSYSIIGNIDKSFICVLLEHDYGPHDWVKKILVFELDYVDGQNELPDHVIFEIGGLGFWLSIWIRVKKAKNGKIYGEKGVTR
ncbi:hypothetical protein [Leptospira santarosai]|uniref:hypothetical protein n=1 Tax=Leptospira santarosai TaxID=28183 RepID=UPI0005183581|nr:hypothetical protein [Leptospira santarosai]